MKVSDTYFRKIRPRTTCLYCAESIFPRSSSAASHSVASRVFDGWAFFLGGTWFLRSMVMLSHLLSDAGQVGGDSVSLLVRILNPRAALAQVLDEGGVVI